jgi:acyl carrier protein
MGNPSLRSGSLRLICALSRPRWHGPYPPGYPKVEQDFDALGMDWLDKIELTMAIEDVFNIEIPDDKVVEEWKTLQDVVQLVAAKLALPSPAAQAAPEPSLGEGSKDELIAALRGILKRYVDFVLSGDGGNWDPEEEAAVIGARAALAKVEGK